MQSTPYLNNIDTVGLTERTADMIPTVAKTAKRALNCELLKIISGLYWKFVASKGRLTMAAITPKETR